MRNFKILLIHEFQQQIHSYKFFLLLILSLVISLICVYVQVENYNEKYKTFIKEKNKASELINSFRVFSEFEIPIIIEPNPLAIFAKGFDDETGNKIIVSVTKLPEFQKTSQENNPYLSIFNNLDIVGMVILILSIITIFLNSDIISSEKENHTLKFIFTNKVSRFEFITAKFVASLLLVSIPVFFIFLFSSIYIVFQPSIVFSAQDWLRIALLFFSCIGYLSVFVLIGFIISINSISNTHSTLYSLIVWLLLVVIYPNSVEYIVSSTIKTTSLNELNSEIDAINKETKEYIKSLKKWPNRPLSVSITSCKGYNSLPGLINNAPIDVYEMFENQTTKGVFKLLESQQTILNIIDNYKKQEYKEIQRSNIFQCILPNHLLRKSVYIISNTDLHYRDDYVFTEVLFYRNRIVKYLESKDAFGMKFFTQIRKEDMRYNMDEYDASVLNKYGDEYNYPHLELNDIPVFQLKEKFNIPFEFFGLFFLLIGLYISTIYSFNKSSLIQR